MKKNKAHVSGCHQSRAPMTRRDFLAHSAWASASTLVVPGMLGLLSKIAFGAEPVAGRMTPFLCLDLAGGGNIAGSNILVGGAAGQADFLPTYASLGIFDARKPGGTTDMTVRLSPQSGLLFHRDSAFFEGLSNELTDTARAKVDGTIFCARSADDTNTNPTNPVYLIAKSQLRAKQRGDLAVLVGSSTSASGGNSTIDMAHYDAAIRSVRVAQPSDAARIVDVGVLRDWLSTGATSGAVLRSRAERILSSIHRLSQSQIDQFTSLELPEQVKALVNAGYVDSRQAATKYMGPDRAGETDPIQDARYHRIFGLDPANGAPNAQTITGRGTRSTATLSKLRGASGIAKLVLEGKANAGTISFGGYDYHQNPRADTDNRDREAGHVLGALINLAEQLGKDLFVYLYTDGGLASGTTTNNSTIDGNAIAKPQWSSDNGTKGATVLFHYRHAGPPAMLRRQVGYFNSSGSVQRDATVISDNIPLLAQAIFHNYLVATSPDPEGELRAILGTSPFADDAHLGFRKG